MVSPCVEVLRQLDRTFNSVLGTDQGTRHAPPDLTNDIQALISSLDEHKVYKIIPGRILTGENEPVKDVVAIGLQNLTEGAKNPLSEYNTAFRRLQMRRRMTPISESDLPTQQSPADPSPPQLEPSIAESVDFNSKISSPRRLDPSTLQVENPIQVSAATGSDENTDKLSLTEDSNFIEPEGAASAEGMDIKCLAGMLDELYSNGETLPRLSELDVAFEMDEVEIVEEEPWDDNDSDSDDGGVSEDEREQRFVS
jgi:hypothetical protein